MYGVWPCFIMPIWGRRQEIAPKRSRREWEGAKAPRSIKRRKAPASEILQAPAGFSSSLLTLSWVAIFSFVRSFRVFWYLIPVQILFGKNARNACERTNCEERARKNRLRESARVTSSVRRSTSVAASLTESLLLRQVGVHSDLIFYHYCYIFYIYFLFIHLFSLFTFIFSFSYLILFNIFLFRLQFALALGTSKTSRDISPHFPTEGHHGCAQSFRDNSERTYHNSCRGQQRACWRWLDETKCTNARKITTYRSRRLAYGSPWQ